MKNYYFLSDKKRIRTCIALLILLLSVGLSGSSAFSQITGTTPGSRCGEGAVTLGATGTGGTITWYSVPFYGTALGTGTTFTTPYLVATTAFYVDVVDANGCGICNRSTVIATVYGASIASNIYYGSSTYCNTVNSWQPVTLTGTPGGTFTATPDGLSLNASTGSILPSTSSQNTYTVTYTVTPPPGCTEPPVSTLVTITSSEVQPVISYTGSPFCTSHAVVNVNQTGATGGTYSATPSGLAIDASTGTITPASSITGAYTVTYYVSGAGGCVPLTATTPVTILQLPTANISYATTPFCHDITGAQSVTLTGTGVYTGGTYTYSGTGTLSLNSSTGAIIPNTSTPGTYTVTYTLAAVPPCASVFTTTSVTVNPLPTATVSGTTSVCQNSTAPNITFTGTTGTAPFTFTYNINGGSTLTVTTTSGNSISLSQPTAASGIYQYNLVSVSDANSCSQAQTGNATITVTALPTADFYYPATPYCSNAVNPQPTFVGGSVAGTFSSTPGLVFVGTSGANAGWINISASTAGTYTVTNTIAA